jgi:hypothetical protein
MIAGYVRLSGPFLAQARAPTALCTTPGARRQAGGTLSSSSRAAGCAAEAAAASPAARRCHPVVLLVAHGRLGRTRSWAARTRHAQEGDGVSPTAIREIMLLRDMDHINIVKVHAGWGVGRSAQGNRNGRATERDSAQERAKSRPLVLLRFGWARTLPRSSAIAAQPPAATGAWQDYALRRSSPHTECGPASLFAAAPCVALRSSSRPTSTEPRHRCGWPLSTPSMTSMK